MVELQEQIQVVGSIGVSAGKDLNCQIQNNAFRWSLGPTCLLSG
jgi:hypothetical protein